MSLRKAINDKCRECIYDPFSGMGNWRQQVSACRSPACPLFAYRPVSKGGRGEPTGRDGANRATLTPKTANLACP
jgi:hypothetical protein